MIIAVTGHEGNVGRELVKWGCTPLVCDILSPASIREAVEHVKPNVLIHAAAMTNVDDCEKSPDDAFKVNARGTSNLLNEFTNGTFIYLSTDHVFSGNRGWWRGAYTERDIPAPVNVYGFTKLGGEGLVHLSSCNSIVVRTSKLVSLDMMLADMTSLNRGYDKEFTDLVRRSFTYLPSFVIALLAICTKLPEISPLVHLCSGKVQSYYQFWCDVRNYFGFTGRVTPRKYKLANVTTRPFNGGLNPRMINKLGIRCDFMMEDLHKEWSKK